VDKVEFIDAFYDDHYQKLMGTGLISNYWALIHKQMEKPFLKKNLSQILEIGAGNGEHLNYVARNFEKYTATDLRLNNLRSIATVGTSIVTSVQNAENLKFDNESFDRVIVTCLLVHLDKPEKAIAEMKRVVKKNGGYVTVYLPCEPGIFLRLVRKYSTHRKAKKLGISNIQRLHYLEHRNYYLAVDNLIVNTFEKSQIQSRFYPFPFLTWNFNLYKIYQVSL
jgi:ubiquinone/menaquinone biosynthesis C-methylase UbiE